MNYVFIDAESADDAAEIALDRGLIVGEVRAVGRIHDASVRRSGAHRSELTMSRQKTSSEADPSAGGGSDRKGSHGGLLFVVCLLIIAGTVWWWWSARASSPEGVWELDADATSSHWIEHFSPKEVKQMDEHLRERLSAEMRVAGWSSQAVISEGVKRFLHIEMTIFRDGTYMGIIDILDGTHTEAGTWKLARDRVSFMPDASEIGEYHAELDPLRGRLICVVKSRGDFVFVMKRGN
ncbi:MAG: hypothetical protein ACTS3F_11345 [Phycisphaerales bacterium]